MHNVCKPTTVSTIAASGRRRVTSVRRIFLILSLAMIPSNHSSLQIIFFFKIVTYFCAFKIFHKMYIWQSSQYFFPKRQFVIANLPQFYLLVWFIYWFCVHGIYNLQSFCRLADLMVKLHQNQFELIH